MRKVLPMSFYFLSFSNDQDQCPVQLPLAKAGLKALAGFVVAPENAPLTGILGPTTDPTSNGPYVI